MNPGRARGLSAGHFFAAYSISGASYWGPGEAVGLGTHKLTLDRTRRAGVPPKGAT